MDNIKLFALRLDADISRSATNKIRRAYGNKINFDTFYLMHRRIALLSGLQLQIYDCCINSCCAYTNMLSEATNCPICSEDRYDINGRPRNRYEYLPVIPRLQGYFRSCEMVSKMSYRSNRRHIPGEYTDIFDGSHYQELIQTELVVEGICHDVNIFNGVNDIAIGLLSDGVQVFKKIRNGSATAWPFILLNYNLDPSIRTHLQYLLPLGLAPGPHPPTDHNSFLYPFTQELMMLGHGITTWDTLKREDFVLRGFLLTSIGDMQALKTNQYLRGPNAFSPCRACNMQGCRDPDTHSTNYYYPLHAPEGAVRLDFTPAFDWDPHSLPLRTDQGYRDALTYITEGQTLAEREIRAKTHGLNGESIFVLLPGFSRTRSCPHEAMHLIWENLVPMMVDFWTGRFKGLDMGSESYEIPTELWLLIGEETAAAVPSILAVFCCALPNIAKEQHLFTAEAWAFWTVHLAPYLLEG